MLTTQTNTPSLPSHYCFQRSPIITICLEQPPPTPTPQPSTDSSRKRKRKAKFNKKRKLNRVSEGDSEYQPTGGEGAKSANSDPDDSFPAFQVHLSALTASSDYFKLLLAFNGLEMAERKVVFEMPGIDSELDPRLGIEAFKLYVDYSYSGTFDLSSYEYENSIIYKDGKAKASADRSADVASGVVSSEQSSEVEVNATQTERKQDSEEASTSTDKTAKLDKSVRYHGYEMIFIAVAYVLADRLLAEGLKQALVKKMYQNMMEFFESRAHSGCSTSCDEASCEKLHKMYNSVYWNQFGTTAQILFHATKTVTKHKTNISSSQTLKMDETPREFKLASYISTTSSPMITVHLRQSGKPSPALQTQPSAEGHKPLKRKRKNNPGKAEAHHADQSSSQASAESLNSPPLPTFHVHLAALTAHSQYFSSLSSFNGLEMTEQKVTLHLPRLDPSIDPCLAVEAAKLFIDYCYGGYDVRDYAYDMPYLEAAGSSKSSELATVEEEEEYYCKSEMHHGKEMVFIAVAYVLADRLLAEGLKQKLVKSMYRSMMEYHGSRDDLKGGNSYSEAYARIYKSTNWDDFKKRARIIFNGTRTRFLGVKGYVERYGMTPPTGHAQKAVLTSTENVAFRQPWLGKEYMRNLLCAFFSTLWSCRKHTDWSVRHPFELVEEVPGMAKPLLACLMIPEAHREDLKRFPNKDFGLPEEFESSGNIRYT
ncbi:hypothetical protein BJ508DRAFT_333870 [Ascobolus immersus RN42]|uniref:BTB domain-containing protein n=1 Tax=Ascobolus immersus RN42 TaxID=1160509 RepID=A0A3N4HL68_ASCIM|nr:hypothetical protein BJ508DRAFT_333870 [Ascobolus immersus RN42]